MGNMTHFNNIKADLDGLLLPTEMTEDKLKMILTEWAELKTWKAFMTQFLNNMGSEDVSVFLAEIHILAQENSPTIQRWLAGLNAEVEPEPEITVYEMSEDEARAMAAVKDAELDQLASDIINGNHGGIVASKPGNAFRSDKEVIADGVAALAQAGRES